MQINTPTMLCSLANQRSKEDKRQSELNDNERIRVETARVHFVSRFYHVQKLALEDGYEQMQINFVYDW